MIHRGIPWLPVEELHNLVNERRRMLLHRGNAVKAYVRVSDVEWNHQLFRLAESAVLAWHLDKIFTAH
jgi:hypothetical protein